MLHDSTYRHTLFYCVSLYLSFVDAAFFTSWKFVVPLPWASLLALFFQQHLFTSCLWVTFSNYNISEFFIMLLFVGIYEQWSVLLLSLLFWGHHKLHLCKSVNLVCKFCMYSDCSIDEPFPYSSSSPWASLFPETQQYWNKANYQSYNGSKCSSEKKSFTSLT